MVRRSKRENKRKPERYREDDEAEQMTLSESQSAISASSPQEISSPTPPPATTSYPTLSPPSLASSTPISPTRRGGVTWRNIVRATLRQVNEEEATVQSPVQPASLPPQPDAEPVYTKRDDYDISSPGFGIKHTPKWNYTGIDMDHDSQPRWFPPATLGSPSYERLTDACKLMLVQELTKRMSFKSMVSWLQLSDEQLIDFTGIYGVQAQRNIEEHRLTLIAMSHLSAIRNEREVTTKDWDRVLEEEVDSKLGPSLVDSPIPLEEIGRTIRFLQCFRSQEELSDIDKAGGSQIIFHDDVPTFSVIQEVFESMKRYAKLSITMEWDFDHEIGLKEYIENETDLAGGVDGIIISDDEGDEEAEEPARRPVGRPKKRGPQFTNKPILHRSNLLKLRQPTKLQQVESAEDEA